MVSTINKCHKLVVCIVSLHPHQTAQALHQQSFCSTVWTPLLACCRQCQRRPLSFDLNVDAKRSSPQTADDLNISNYTILNTFKLHASRIWLFPACPNTLSPLRVVNSYLPKIQSNAWTWVPTLTMLKSSPTSGLTYHHLLCHAQKLTPVLALFQATILFSCGKAMLRVAFRGTSKTFPTTHLQHVGRTNTSSMGSKRWVCRCIMTRCWGRRKSPLSVSEASNMGMLSRYLWRACQLILLSGSGNIHSRGYEMEWHSPMPYQILYLRHHQKHEIVHMAAPYTKHLI